jgi:hypothetical protein
MSVADGAKGRRRDNVAADGGSVLVRSTTIARCRHNPDAGKSARVGADAFCTVCFVTNN